MSHEYIVKQSEEICKCLNQLRFRKILSDVYMEHIMAIIHSVFMPGYHGKIANTKYFSEKHRTSVAHFLNDGKWDSLEVERSFRKQVVDTVDHESRKADSPFSASWTIRLLRIQRLRHRRCTPLKRRITTCRT